MPWLDIDHLHISTDVWAKLYEKHGIDAAALRRHLLDQRTFPFEWLSDRRGDRACVEATFEGLRTTVILYPIRGALARHWRLATAFHP